MNQFKVMFVGCGLLFAPFVEASVADVDALLQRGRTLEALQVVDLALEQNSDDLAFREMRVDIRVGMGFGAGEVSTLDEHLGSHSGDADGWYLLGRALLDAERSIAAYQEAIRLQPDHARAWMGLGSLQQAGEDCEGADSSYAHALAIDATLREAWIGQIRCRVDAGGGVLARELATRLVEILPMETAGWMALAALDVESELQHLEQGLVHRPGDRELLGFLLDAALAARDLDRALLASNQLFEAGDTGVESTHGMLEEIQTGILTWDVLEELLGQQDGALSVARVAVLTEEFSESKWIDLVYARTLWIAGEIAPAETLLHALMMELDGGAAHRTLGLLYVSTQRPAEAAQVFLPLTEIRPDDLEAQILLSMSLVDAGQPSLAEAYLDDLLVLHPLDQGVRYTHTYVLMLNGENDRAVEACVFYLRYWPDEGVASWLTAAALQSEQQSVASVVLQELRRTTGNQAYGALALQLID